MVNGNFGKLLRYCKHVVKFEVEGMFRTRLQVYFDINLKEMKKLYKTAKRKRCFIVATGPSLTKEDVELLSNEVTFGVNSIFQIYDQTEWRPDYYVCTDSVYFERIWRDFNLNIKQLAKKDVFLNKKSQNIIQPDEYIHNIYFSNWNRVYDFQNYKFTNDIVHGLYAFGTVTNITMAIAMYMGFEEIYLLGVDCSNLKTHFVDNKDYSGYENEFENKIIQAQLSGYSAMQKETNARNVKIYNATRGGALETFERISLEKALEKSEI